jgi:hypothetical protein
MAQVVERRYKRARDSAGPTMGLLEEGELEKFWPQIVNMLQTVPHTWTHWTIDTFWEQAERGNLQVWGIGLGNTISLVLFTQVVRYPALSTLHVIWAGGKFREEYIPIIDSTLARFGEIQECDRLEVIGRPGWEKMFKNWGMVKVSTVLAKPIRKTRMN